MLKKYSIGKKDFAYIYKKGKRINLGNFTIIFASNHKIDSQFSIIVSTKVERLATRRNWMKRQIKARLINCIDKIQKGNYYLILVRNSFYQSAESEKLIEGLLYKLQNIR